MYQQRALFVASDAEVLKYFALHPAQLQRPTSTAVPEQFRTVSVNQGLGGISHSFRPGDKPSRGHYFACADRPKAMD